MSPKPLRIVVTGRSGQVAKALLGRRAFGLELVSLARPDIDLDAPSSVAAALLAARPDVVISAAAYTAVDAAEDDCDAAFRVNAQSVGEMAQACRRKGASLLHLSTDYVFDGLKGAPYVEADSPDPQTVYGASKLAGEAALRDVGGRALVLRTSWVFGEAGRNFVNTMLALAQTRDRVQVVEDQRGCPTSADDLAGALLAIAPRFHAGEGETGVLHLSGQGEATWADLAEAVFTAATRRGAPSAGVERVSSAAFPTRAARPSDTRLDCERFARTWGLELPLWRTSLEATMDQRLGRSAHERIA